MKLSGLFSSVASRVTVIFLVVTTLVLSGLSGMLLKRANEKAGKSFYDRMVVTASTLSLSFALPVKSADASMIKAIAAQAMQSDLIYAIDLEAESGGYYFRRTSTGKAELQDTPITPEPGLMSASHVVSVNGESLGVLTVYMLPVLAGASLHQWVLVTVISIVLIDLLLVCVVYATLWLLVLYPLSQLKEHAQGIKNDPAASPASAGSSLYGEFRVVSDTIDEMANSLRLKILEVEKANRQSDHVARKFPIPVGTYDTDTGEILFINDKFIEVFGYEPEDIPNIEDWYRLVFPDPVYREEAAKMWLDNWDQANKTGAPMHQFERIMCSKDRQEKIIEVSGVIFDGHFTLVIFNDITDRKQAEKEVLNQQTRLRKLTAHVQEVREEERKRIARELHDELGQILTVAKIDLANLEHSMTADSENLAEEIARLVSTIDQASDTTRQISENLRPGMLDLLGLGPALELHVTRFQQSTLITVDLLLEGKGDDKTEFDIEDRVATTAFRIVQEALTNVAKYSRAESVSVSVVMLENELVIVIRDDGVGFDAESQQRKPSFGLLGMRERAQALSGDLSIETAPGKGVRIEASLPYRDEELS